MLWLVEQPQDLQLLEVGLVSLAQKAVVLACLWVHSPDPALDQRVSQLGLLSDSLHVVLLHRHHVLQRLQGLDLCFLCVCLVLLYLELCLSKSHRVDSVAWPLLV